VVSCFQPSTASIVEASASWAAASPGPGGGRRRNRRRCCGRHTRRRADGPTRRCGCRCNCRWSDRRGHWGASRAATRILFMAGRLLLPIPVRPIRRRRPPLLQLNSAASFSRSMLVVPFIRARTSVDRAAPFSSTITVRYRSCARLSIRRRLAFPSSSLRAREASRCQTETRYSCSGECRRRRYPSRSRRRISRLDRRLPWSRVGPIGPGIH